MWYELKIIMVYALFKWKHMLYAIELFFNMQLNMHPIEFESWLLWIKVLTMY